MSINYTPGNLDGISFLSKSNQIVKLSNEKILEAINLTHDVIDKFGDFDVDVFEILGMRNLSSFIGELFAASCVKISNGLLIKNPHQDGYPDMLLMDASGKLLYESLNRRDKTPFSPFENGGIEVKATVGSVPTPKILMKKGLLKPTIGDSRIHLLKTYDWKAHHRDTNNLLGILWDFIDGVPRIAAVFFSDKLTIDDWGKIIQPKDGGGRTTSVSIMTRIGVKKMYDGSIFIINDPKVAKFLQNYNS